MEKRNCPEARPAWTTTKLRRCIGSAALMVIVFFLFLSFFRGCHIESFDSRHGNSIAELGYPEKTTSKKQLPFVDIIDQTPETPFFASDLLSDFERPKSEVEKDDHSKAGSDKLAGADSYASDAVASAEKKVKEDRLTE